MTLLEDGACTLNYLEEIAPFLYLIFPWPELERLKIPMLLPPQFAYYEPSFTCPTEQNRKGIYTFSKRELNLVTCLRPLRGVDIRLLIADLSQKMENEVRY